MVVRATTRFLGTVRGLDVDRVLELSKSWGTSIEMPGIQPKRSIRSKVVGYIGAPKDCTVLVKATIYGDCFPEPRHKELNILFKVKPLKFTALDVANELKERRKKGEAGKTAATERKEGCP